MRRARLLARRRPCGRDRSHRSCTLSKYEPLTEYGDALHGTIWFWRPLRKYPGRVDPLSRFQPENTRLVRAGVRRGDPGADHRLARDRHAARHTLIQAPTGSGKTLAAFLYGIDKLNSEPGGRACA